MPDPSHSSHTAGVPVTITIRNVPEVVRDELAARASRAGRPLQEYLVGLLTELASRPSLEDAVGDVRIHVGATGHMDATQILADRDAERP
jgi:antitoxin FitA